MRLKASSIYYALFLSVIVALFLGGMILFSGVNKQYASQLEIQERLIDNAYSGVQYGLANSQEISDQEPLELLLFGKATDSVLIERKKWGAFEVIVSTAHHGRNHYSKIALAGQQILPQQPTLYLVDQGRPLSICGETRIEGPCKIPQAGLKRAYIEGQNYLGTEMIYGSSSNSNKGLPEINTQFIDQISTFQGEIRIWENLDSLTQSFSEPGIHFVDDHFASLSNTYLSGQIIIETKDSIFVGATAQLDQIILKSKVIYIQKGFKGSIQAYASEKIVLEDEVTLLYPSVLGLLEESPLGDENSQITIGAKSQVIGSVFALSEKPDFRKPVQISIAKEAEIDGLVYCQGRTQLNGTVKGSLYTQKFFLETPSSKYENHLLNGKILNGLPEEFVFIALLEQDAPLTQIAWLQ